MHGMCSQALEGVAAFIHSFQRLGNEEHMLEPEPAMLLSMHQDMGS